MFLWYMNLLKKILLLIKLNKSYQKIYKYHRNTFLIWVVSAEKYNHDPICLSFSNKKVMKSQPQNYLIVDFNSNNHNYYKVVSRIFLFKKVCLKITFKIDTATVMLKLWFLHIKGVHILFLSQVLSNQCEIKKFTIKKTPNLPLVVPIKYNRQKSDKNLKNYTV